MSLLYERLPISDENKQLFSKYRDALNKFLDEPSMLKLNEKSFTNKELLEVMVYGDKAHVNPDKRRFFEEIKGFGPFFMIARLNFEGIIINFSQVVWGIRTLNMKVLNELGITLE